MLLNTGLNLIRAGGYTPAFLLITKLINHIMIYIYIEVPMKLDKYILLNNHSDNLSLEYTCPLCDYTLGIPIYDYELLEQTKQLHAENCKGKLEVILV